MVTFWHYKTIGLHLPAKIPCILVERIPQRRRRRALCLERSPERSKRSAVVHLLTNELALVPLTERLFATFPTRNQGVREIRGDPGKRVSARLATSPISYEIAPSHKALRLIYMEREASPLLIALTP